MNVANTFNIETTLNEWLKAQLNAVTAPIFFSGFPGDRLIFNMPEKPANVPAYSGHHLFIDTVDRWQGRRGDNDTYAVNYRAWFDVSVWVTRANGSWASDKRWMCAVLKDIVNQTVSVSLDDYLTGYPTPADTDYKIVIEGIEARQTEADPNPDFDRERFLIGYRTILRSDRS